MRRHREQMASTQSTRSQNAQHSTTTPHRVQVGGCRAASVDVIGLPRDRAAEPGPALAPPGPRCPFSAARPDGRRRWSPAMSAGHGESCDGPAPRWGRGGGRYWALAASRVGATAARARRPRACAAAARARHGAHLLSSAKAVSHHLEVAVASWQAAAGYRSTTRASSARTDWSSIRAPATSVPPGGSLSAWWRFRPNRSFGLDHSSWRVHHRQDKPSVRRGRRVRRGGRGPRERHARIRHSDRRVVP
jgi:hypothetical protein